MRSVGLVMLFTIVPLAVLMWRQVRRGKWENADASNRAERPHPVYRLAVSRSSRCSRIFCCYVRSRSWSAAWLRRSA